MEQQTSAKITPDMMIGEAVAAYPEIADVFLSYGLHCVGCHVNAYETIEQGAMSHGMVESEIEEMIAEANLYLEQAAKRSSEPFSVTPKALVKLQELAKEEEKSGWGLRVEVQPGGCSGFRYNLEFEEKPKADDVIIAGDVALYLDADSAQMLMGGNLDYVDGLQGSGFKVNNPNAKSNCGCGKSFN